MGHEHHPRIPATTSAQHAAPDHILKGLGAQVPQYAHLSLIPGDDGTKSQRTAR